MVHVSLEGVEAWRGWRGARFCNGDRHAGGLIIGRDSTGHLDFSKGQIAVFVGEECRNVILGCLGEGLEEIPVKVHSDAKWAYGLMA